MAHKLLIRDVVSMIELSVSFFQEALLRARGLQHICTSISQRLLFRLQFVGTGQGRQCLRISGFLMGDHTSIVLIKSTDMY